MLGKNTILRGGFGTYYSVYEQVFFPGPTKPPFGTGHTIRTTNTIATTSDFTLDNLFPPLPVQASGFVIPGTVSPNQVPDINTITPRLMNVNAAAQHSLTSNLTVEVGYAWKRGEHLSNFKAINPCVPYSQPCQLDPVYKTQIRYYKNFAQIYMSVLDGRNFYHSGYARMTRRFSKGLSFDASYTWSQNISEGYDSMSNDIFQGGDAGATVADLTKPKPWLNNNRKRSLLDVPNKFVVNGIYELPVGKGKRLLGNASGTANRIVGGWQVSWITMFQSGQVVDLTGFGQARFLPGQGRNLKRMDFRTTGYFFDPNLFTRERVGTDLVPPNCFRGAGINNWDISLLKEVPISERHRIQLRADFFNAFNHAQFETPQHRIYGPGFGKFVPVLDDNKGNSVRPPRSIQVALRYTF